MITVISSNDFEYHAGIMTAEASMLDHLYGRGAYFSDVTNDGYTQMGFIIQSAKTGGSLTFVHHKTLGGGEEHDGETIGWEFKPVGKNLPENMKNLTVKIYNT